MKYLLIALFLSASIQAVPLAAASEVLCGIVNIQGSLPSDTSNLVIKVSLLEASRADMRAKLVERTFIEAPTSNGIKFSLPYPSYDQTSSGYLTLEAALYDRLTNKTLFRTVQSYPVQPPSKNHFYTLDLIKI